jgi:hypothetical protein
MASNKNNAYNRVQTQSDRLWTAVFDYETRREDELTLRRGTLVEVLSTPKLVLFCSVLSLWCRVDTENQPYDLICRIRN